MKNHLNISYQDLIVDQERQLKFMKETYPGRVLAGSLTAKVSGHRIACAEALLKMLKKHKKDPQLNLNDAFDRLRPRPSVDIPEHLVNNIDHSFHP